MKKAMFFFPATGYYSRAISNPLGLLSIASFLKHHGYEVRIEDRNIENVNLKKTLRAFQPDIVGVSIMSARGINDAVKISRAAKQYGCPVVWGGQLPSMQPELAFESGYVDYVSLSEGECTWLDLMDALEQGGDLSQVAGLAVKDETGYHRTAERPFMDLAEVGKLDFSLIKTEKYLQTYLGCKRMIYLYSAKGCPGNCAFCANTVFHKRTFRKRPIETVVEEIKELVDGYQVDGIYFSDELWCLRRDDLVYFCDLLKKNDIHVRWGIQLRIGMFNEEDYRMIYDAGCRWIFFGVETGSPEMQKRIHKPLNFDKVVETFDITDRVGITTVASMIIGYPGETEAQLRDTVKIMNSIKASLIPIFHFTPIPGTELYNEVVSNGTYKPPQTIRKMAKVVATESLGQNLSAVPDRDLKVIRNWYAWKALSAQQSVKSDHKFEFAIDTVKSGLHAISMRGAISFFINGFVALKDFVYMFWYSHAYPGIVKKYGLDIEYK